MRSTFVLNRLVSSILVFTFLFTQAVPIAAHPESIEGERSLSRRTLRTEAPREQELPGEGNDLVDYLKLALLKAVQFVTQPPALPAAGMETVTIEKGTVLTKLPAWGTLTLVTGGDYLVSKVTADAMTGSEKLAAPDAFGVEQRWTHAQLIDSTYTYLTPAAPRAGMEQSFLLPVDDIVGRILYDDSIKTLETSKGTLQRGSNDGAIKFSGSNLRQAAAADAKNGYAEVIFGEGKAKIVAPTDWTLTRQMSQDSAVSLVRATQEITILDAPGGPYSRKEDGFTNRNLKQWIPAPAVGEKVSLKVEGDTVTILPTAAGMEQLERVLVLGRTAQDVVPVREAIQQNRLRPGVEVRVLLMPDNLVQVVNLYDENIKQSQPPNVVIIVGEDTLDVAQMDLVMNLLDSQGTPWKVLIEENVKDPGAIEALLVQLEEELAGMESVEGEELGVKDRFNKGDILVRRETGRRWYRVAQDQKDPIHPVKVESLEEQFRQGGSIPAADLRIHFRRIPLMPFRSSPLKQEGIVLPNGRLARVEKEGGDGAYALYFTDSDGQNRQRIEGVTPVSPNALLLDPNGRWLAVGGRLEERYLKLVDPETGKVIRQLDSDVQLPSHLTLPHAVSSDGRWLAASYEGKPFDRGILIFDVEGEQLTRMLVISAEQASALPRISWPVSDENGQFLFIIQASEGAPSHVVLIRPGEEGNYLQFMHFIPPYILQIPGHPGFTPIHLQRMATVPLNLVDLHDLRVEGSDSFSVALGDTDQRQTFQYAAGMESIAERVIDIVAEQLGVEDKEKIRPETSFVNDLGADSIDTVELVMKVEEEFGISIPDDTAEKIETVGQLIEFVEGEQAAGMEGAYDEALAHLESELLRAGSGYGYEIFFGSGDVVALRSTASSRDSLPSALNATLDLSISVPKKVIIAGDGSGNLNVEPKMTMGDDAAGMESVGELRGDRVPKVGDVLIHPTARRFGPYVVVPGSAERRRKMDGGDPLIFLVKKGTVGKAATPIELRLSLISKTALLIPAAGMEGSGKWDSKRRIGIFESISRAELLRLLDKAAVHISGPPFYSRPREARPLRTVSKEILAKKIAWMKTPISAYTEWVKVLSQGEYKLGIVRFFDSGGNIVWLSNKGPGLFRTSNDPRFGKAGGLFAHPVRMENVRWLAPWSRRPYPYPPTPAAGMEAVTEITTDPVRSGRVADVMARWRAWFAEGFGNFTITQTIPPLTKWLFDLTGAADLPFAYGVVPNGSMVILQDADVLIGLESMTGRSREGEVTVFFAENKYSRTIHAAVRSLRSGRVEIFSGRPASEVRAAAAGLEGVVDLEVFGNLTLAMLLDRLGVVKNNARQLFERLSEYAKSLIQFM